jgi:hypothetical protein
VIPRLARRAAHVEMLDQERRDFGPDYEDHGLLFCRTLTPSRGGSSAYRALRALPEIDLHDVRRSYTTAGRKAKIDWKARSMVMG